MNDLKFALRQLLKNPSFTSVAVLTLALGAKRGRLVRELLPESLLSLGDGAVGLLAADSRRAAGLFCSL